MNGQLAQLNHTLSWIQDDLLFAIAFDIGVIIRHLREGKR